MLREYFQNRHCFTLVRPVIEEALLQDLQSQPASALRPEFRKDLSRLCSALVNGPDEAALWAEEGDAAATAATETTGSGFDTVGDSGGDAEGETEGALLCAKRVSGRVLSGSMLASMVQTYVAALFGDGSGKGGVAVGAVSIADAWTSALRQECSTGFKEAKMTLVELDMLGTEVERSGSGRALPCDEDTLRSLCRRTFVSALLQYRSRTGSEDLSRGAVAIAECRAEDLGFALYMSPSPSSSSASSSSEANIQARKENMDEDDGVIFKWEIKLYKEAVAAFAKLRKRNAAASAAKCMSLLRDLMDTELAKKEKGTDASSKSEENDGKDPELELARDLCYGPLDVIRSFVSSLQKYGEVARGPWGVKVETLAKYAHREILENLGNKSCSDAAEQVQTMMRNQKTVATNARVEADSTKERLSQALESVKTANERAQAAQNEVQAANNARATLEKDLQTVRAQLKDAREASASAAKKAAAKLEAAERSAGAENKAANAKAKALRTRNAELEGKVDAFRAQAQAADEKIQNQTHAIQSRSTEAAEMAGKVRALQMQLEDSKVEKLAAEREAKAREAELKAEGKRLAAAHERK